MIEKEKESQIMKLEKVAMWRCPHCKKVVDNPLEFEVIQLQHEIKKYKLKVKELQKKILPTRKRLSKKDKLFLLEQYFKSHPEIKARTPSFIIKRALKKKYIAGRDMKLLEDLVSLGKLKMVEVPYPVRGHGKAYDFFFQQEGKALKEIIKEERKLLDGVLQ